MSADIRALQVSNCLTVSLTARLQQLRAHQLAAPLACCIISGITESDAAKQLMELALAAGYPAIEGTALRVEPDSRPLRRTAAESSSDSHATEENEDNDDDHDTVWIDTDGDWLRQASSRAVAVAAASGAACVWHDVANGRIGLMLRRCPPLEVLVEQVGEEQRFSAWLQGQQPPDLTASPTMNPPRHLGARL